MKVSVSALVSNTVFWWCLHTERRRKTPEHLLRVYIISKASSGLESWGSRSKGKEPHYGQTEGASPRELRELENQEKALEIQQGLVLPGSRWSKAALGTNTWVSTALMWKWHSGYVTQQKCVSVSWIFTSDSSGWMKGIRRETRLAKQGKWHFCTCLNIFLWRNCVQVIYQSVLRQVLSWTGTWRRREAPLQPGSPALPWMAQRKLKSKPMNLRRHHLPRMVTMWQAAIH